MCDVHANCFVQGLNDDWKKEIKRKQKNKTPLKTRWVYDNNM